MANRIFDNVIYLDTASANVSVFSGRAKVGTVAFWSSGTGTVVITANNTANIVVRLGKDTSVPGTVSLTLPDIQIENLKVPVLSAGTAWVYYS